MPSCVDPPDVDDNGHGTHVAGIVAAALNGRGVSGVAPKVQLVNIRMSFYTDPWLFNCLDNPADSLEAQAEQRTIRVVTQRAINFARAHAVTPVGALGNQNTDLGNPTEVHTSPDFPPGSAYPRDVDNSCITVPVETRGVISVSALGPSHRKAHYSNWGPRADRLLGPWRVLPRLLRHRPVQPAREPDPVHLPAERPPGQRGGRPDGNPTTPLVVRDRQGGSCSYYRYLQGTSMAAPHAAGVAAVIVGSQGRRDASHGGLTLSPRTVERVLTRTAKQTPCPTPPIFTYPDPDLGAPYDAPCEGTLARNGIYGRGIVNALTAVLD